MLHNIDIPCSMQVMLILNSVWITTLGLGPITNTGNPHKAQTNEVKSKPAKAESGVFAEV